ncbi:MAG: 50S ribosomal protein L24 [Kineosporiaceae bacterium]
MSGRQQTAAKPPRMRIKKGDLVVVIRGGRTKVRDGVTIEGDRGKTGRVIAVDRERRRVTVEGVNRVTKHIKPGRTASGANRAGGLVHTEAPLHVSKVALVDPKTKKPTRLGVRIDMQERDGRQRPVRVRIARRSGEEIS